MRFNNSFLVQFMGERSGHSRSKGLSFLLGTWWLVVWNETKTSVSFLTPSGIFCVLSYREDNGHIKGKRNTCSVRLWLFPFLFVLSMITGAR